MSTKKTLILNILENNNFLNEMTKIIMEWSGCNEEFIKKNPVDYIKTENIYKNVVQEFAMKIFDENLQEPEAEKLLEILNHNMFKKYNDLIVQLGSVDPLKIAEPILDHKELPDSFKEHLFETMVSPIRHNSNNLNELENSDKETIAKIKIENKSDLDELMKMIKKISEKDESTIDIDQLIKKLTKNPTEHDCEQCDSFNCENYTITPKKNLLN